MGPFDIIAGWWGPFQFLFMIILLVFGYFGLAQLIDLLRRAMRAFTVLIRGWPPARTSGGDGNA